MNFESHVVPVACIAVEKLRKRGCYQGTSRGLYVLLSFFLLFALSFPCNLVLKINEIMLCVMALLY